MISTAKAAIPRMDQAERTISGRGSLESLRQDMRPYELDMVGEKHLQWFRKTGAGARLRWGEHTGIPGFK